MYRPHKPLWDTIFFVNLIRLLLWHHLPTFSCVIDGTKPIWKILLTSTQSSDEILFKGISQLILYGKRIPDNWIVHNWVIVPIDSRPSKYSIKKAGTLSIKREPLDGAYTNRHSCLYARPPWMVSRHIKPESSIWCKKLSRFSLLDELPFTLGITPPSSTTKIRKNAKTTNNNSLKVLIYKDRGLRPRRPQTSKCIVLN